MIIEQAMYGATRDGHAILDASGARSISEEIATRLDLPDTAPPGVEWSPYLSGFPYKSFYVLARTILDTEAERGGIVFAHALIAPLEEFVSIKNLRPFVKHLSERPQRPLSLDSMHILSEDEEVIESPSELIGTANVLLSRKSGPAVRLGVDRFDELIIALWARLWPLIREQFAFRLSFSPSDLTEVPQPALICTPRNLATRWLEHQLITPSDQPGVRSAAASVLVGDSAGQALLDFAIKLGLEMKSFSDLALVEQAHRLYGKGNDLDALIAIIRLVERLSPTPGVGATQKEQLLKELVRLISTATPEQVLLLRNFGITKVSGIELLWQQLATWMHRHSYPQSDDGSLVTVVDSALTETGGILEWRQAILAGLNESSLSPGSAFPLAFWRWATLAPNVSLRLFEVLSTDYALEDRLERSVPDELSKDAATGLMKASVFRHWLKLHGAIGPAIYSSEDAVRQQLDVDTVGSSFGGLRAAMRRATPNEIINCAVRWSDPRLRLLAGEAVVKHPQALASFDFANLQVQRVWTEAMRLSPEMWQAPAQPSLAASIVIDALLDGKEVDHGLIAELAKSPVANLLEYPRRLEVWSLLTGDVASRYLIATARSWMQRFIGGEMSMGIEPALQNALLADETLYSELNRLLPDLCVTGLALISALPGFDQARFLTWLALALARIRSFSDQAATRMGHLILRHRWTKAAERPPSRVAMQRSQLPWATRRRLWLGFPRE